MAAVLPDDFGHSRVLMLNRYHAAKYTENPELRYGYIHYVEDRFITPIITGNTAPKSILVIGAGGFTFGKDDRRNAYTFVDIDPELKDISEKYLLKHKLDENKKFVASDARTFVRNNKQKYDLIFLDAFNNPNNIPAHLITREFFQDVRNVLAPGGRVVFNAISSPTMSDRYSVNIANTFNAVFPNASRQIIQTFDGWKKDQDKVNIIYMFFEDAPPASEPYQDRKNPFFYDMKK
ncbi:MAG: fused MFS/spermidine synthase [Rickettsiales bacterium]